MDINGLELFPIIEQSGHTPDRHFIVKTNDSNILIPIEYDRSNCKLSLIKTCGMMLINKKEGGKYIIDERYRRVPDVECTCRTIKTVLSVCRIVTFLNTIDVRLKDIILDNFDIYGYSAIPVGYGGGYQYHIHIRNPYGIANANMRPSEYIPKGDAVPRTKIGESITTVLKKHRRKTDIVDEILKQL